MAVWEITARAPTQRASALIVRAMWPLRLTAVLGLLGLAVYNQPYYPVTWLDEGFVLQGAMNLVRYGMYALRSSEGFRVLDQPLIANGPGVILPIALAFHFGGVGLLQARLAALGLMVLAVFCYYALGVRLYGGPAAAIGSLLLLAVPEEGFLLYGRLALGNVPALGYALAGYLLWLASLERRRTWALSVGTGLLFGFAAATKGQYLLLLPILVGVGVLDFYYCRSVGTFRIGLTVATMALCVAAWYAVQLVVVGPEHFADHLRAIRSSSDVTVFAFRARRIPGTLLQLVRMGAPLFVLPGWVYVAWLSRFRTPSSARNLIILVFIPVWLCWYVLASVGWPRYAFDAYALGLLATGKLVADVLHRLAKGSLPRLPFGPTPLAVLMGPSIALAVLIGGVLGLAQQVERVTAPVDRSPQNFARVLQQTVEPGRTVESWEWELDALADVPFHHPPNVWVDKATAYLQFGEHPVDEYQPDVQAGDYVVDGPFSKWTEMYASYLSEHGALAASAGPYDLYRVIR